MCSSSGHGRSKADLKKKGLRQRLRKDACALLSKGRPEKEGIKTALRGDRAALPVGPKADLKKKGLRRSLSFVLLPVEFKSRPEKEGIKTSSCLPFGFAESSKSRPEKEGVRTRMLALSGLVIPKSVSPGWMS